MEKIVVTRHDALREYLVRKGVVSEDTPVVTHATEEDIAGKHVFGVLPLSLAKLAGAVTEIPLSLPRELRGQELTLEQVEQYAGEPATYVVAEQKHYKTLIYDIEWYRSNQDSSWTASEALENLIGYGLHNMA